MILVCLCRRGFEKETSAEISDKASMLGVAGYVKALPNAGFVEYVCPDLDQALLLLKKIPFGECIFIRHWFATEKIVESLPKDDRVTPLMESVNTLPKVKQLEPITLDTNEGKSLIALTKGVSNHLRQAFKQKKQIEPKSGWVGQCLFLSGEKACVGVFWQKNASHFNGGIPRLRLPKGAPSRATLKLDEAWHQFVPRDEWEHRIAPSMRAVDLGAAPGGWTWQLINKSMFVDAVDNGPMQESIMDSGQVTHYTEDAYRFEPAKKVHWLVSDIADKPARVAQLIAHWGLKGWCQEAIFNLKLPMKKRYNEVLSCRDSITEALDQAGVDYELKFKQLYHDREEVTGHLRIRS